MQQFPDIKEREEMRKIIGRYGLSGQQQVRYDLSGDKNSTHPLVTTSEI